jgi:hypothetical protein
MHYKIPGLNLDIDDKEKFAKEVGLEMENGISKFTFKSNDLRDIQNKVIFMNLNN